MKTIVKSNKFIGGSLLGEVPSYPVSVLTKLFGKPEVNLDYKVQHEWTVSYQEDGKELAIFRIYDYYGDRWHIGGEKTEIVNKRPFNKYVEGFIDILNAMVEGAKK